MRRSVDRTISCFRIAAAVLLLAGLMTSALAQDRLTQRDQTAQQDRITERDQMPPPDPIYAGGIVEDWTSHHVVFPNPGTMEDAIRNGTYEKWHQIVSDPRYRMQWMKRNATLAGQAATPVAGSQRSVEDDWSGPIFERRKRKFQERDESTLQGMWQVSLSGGGNASAPDKFPAKFTFSPIYGADCVNDYVVFPIAVAGAQFSQANLLGVNNLYKTTCSGTVPTVKFAYYVGTGVFQTSPVLAENGTKIAFVESITGNGTSTGSKFHVLTIGTGGNSGCPSSNPCNGNAFSPPVQPSTVNGSSVNTLNNAVDNNIVMSGFVSDTRSSPFVDYTHDIAYVGDDNGKLHKFTGVFLGTPTEAGSPWPVAVAPAGTIMTPPLFDGGASQNIYIGGSNSVLYCITAAGASCGSVTVGTNAIVGTPIIDITYEEIYTFANNTTTGHAVLTQVPISSAGFGTPISANMGYASSATNGTIDLYGGAFDNTYNTTGTGYMYFCGSGATAAYSTLYRVVITSGVMSSANDGNSYPLESSSNGNSPGTTDDCSPLTEYYNSGQGIDWLFIGVGGSGSAVCGFSHGCIESFNITSGAFPSADTAENSTNFNPAGTTGIIIDNPSTVTGASQIYFGNIGAGTGEQLSQSGLQ